MSHLEPHHLVVVAPVGKDHLGAVLAQPVADATAHKAVGPEDGHNVAAERGPTATAAFHRRQVDRAVSGLQLEKKLLPVKKIRRLLRSHKPSTFVGGKIFRFLPSPSLSLT